MADRNNNDLVIGRNAVSESLRSGRLMDKVLVAKGNRSGSIGKIIAICREKHIVVKEVDSKKLDFMCGNMNHQGVIAIAAACEYSTLDDIFALAEQRDEKPFIVICDEIEDPHNLGAIIRTAECAGAHGVVIPKRHGAGLTSIVGKTSAGAIEHIPVARVGNITSALEALKERGVWIYGADMNGEDYRKTDFSGAVGLVVGSEGAGIGRLVKDNCDFLVSIPMSGRISSLNASVAAGILMYEVARGR